MLSKSSLEFASGIALSQNRKSPDLSSLLFLSSVNTHRVARHSPPSERKAKSGLTALRARAVQERNRPAVRFRNLARERQTDA
jgi:hypothetical protein